MELELLTYGQVGERYGVNSRTVRRWVGLGVFPPPVKIGGTVRFVKGHVRAFEDGDLFKTTTEPR
jgi:predicted DNA-binding transcriptional regulator AlpA